MSLRFRWDGMPIEAKPGDSIAAALTAAGVRRFGSDRKGRDRGLFCGMGACQECLVSVDGVSGRRACMTTVADGMDVRPHDDASTPPLPDDRPGKRAENADADLVIVGAGPAGLQAAIAAEAAGVSVLVLDERGDPGGQYFKPRAAGYRGRSAPDRQHRKGMALRGRAVAAGVRILTSETVWFARRGADGLFELRTNGPDGIRRIVAKALILATGAYELPAIVPGATLPGVMTIGAAQTLARRHGVLPGQRIVIAGAGPLGLQLAAELIGLGGSIAAVAERSSLADWKAIAAAARLAPDLILDGARHRFTLMWHGVPFLPAHTLIGIEGTGKAEAALLQNGADQSRLRIEADTVLTGEGFAPQVELARLLGVPVVIDARGLAIPERDREGRTAVDGLFIIGDAAGLRGARVAEAEGERAGWLAARHLGSITARHLGRAIAVDAVSAARLDRALAFQQKLWQVFAPAPPSLLPSAATLCRCEGVTAGAVRQAIGDGARDIGAIKRRTRLGMGRCQGRYCSAGALALLAEAGHAVDPASLAAPQLPAKPVGLAALSAEKAEWSGHRQSRPSARPAALRIEPLRQQEADLVIIGGGVTGLSAAYFAASTGARVVLLDRGRIGAEASGGNAGSLHLQLLSWDFGGKAVGGGDLQLRTLPLQKEAIALWGTLETALDADFEIAVTGGMMVAENPEQIRFLEAKARAEAGVGIETHVIDSEAIHAIAPAIARRMVAAAWCPGEGKINPLAATLALATAARAAGATFEELTAVTGIEASGALYRVRTDRGIVTAPRVLIAAGGWSSELGAMLGSRLPVRGAPLQMVVTEPTAPILPCLIAHADRHLTMKQTVDSTILIGGAWTAETGPSGQPLVLAESLEGNLHVAARTVPAVGGLHVVRSWAAMNVDIDGAPLIGALPGRPGITVAATANGYTLGPLMGREAASIALGGPLREDLAPFGFARFG